MIHPQPTTVLILLWEEQVRQPPRHVEPKRSVIGRWLRSALNQGRALEKVPTATPGAPQTQPGRRSPRPRRRGSVGSGLRSRVRRPVCLERRPARLDR